jgi:hypothetical protein
MTIDNGSAAHFGIGRVIGDAFSVAIRRIVTLLGVAILGALPAAAALGAFFASLPGEFPGGLPAPGTTVQFQSFGAGQGVMFFLAWLLTMLSFLVIQAAISYAALQDLRGERVGILASLGRGLAALPRLVLAMLWLLLVMIGLGIAFLVAAFVVNLIASASNSPGFMAAVNVLVGLAVLLGGALLYVRWWVFVPVLVVEAEGPIQSFSRSSALTLGRRWSIFAVLALLVLANFLVSLLNGGLMSQGAVVLATVISIVVGVLGALVNAVIAAVGYFHLRAEKEGFGAADLAQVFD